MKVFRLLIIGLAIVCASACQQDSKVTEAEESYKTGLKYEKGEGVTQDHAEALKWYQKAADQGNKRAENRLKTLAQELPSSTETSSANGLQDVRAEAEESYKTGEKYFGTQDYAEALKWYRKAADQDQADAQMAIGAMYYKGIGVTQDYAEALKWYRLAADTGDGDAQNNLGIMYQNGQGVTQDDEEAFKWLRLAAGQGLVDAQFIIGEMYAEGKGVTKSYREALWWLGKSADQGYAAAQLNIGMMYEYGRGVAKDYDEAVKWYLKAADQGYVKAQRQIAMMYEHGQGVTKDYKEALKWYRKAADQGDAWAQYYVGEMYYYGQGVTQDYSEAMKWFRKAADQGHERAQYDIGTMYEKGEGVTQDYKEAQKWHRKATDQYTSALSNLFNIEVPVANGRKPPILSSRDVQADEGDAVQVPSQAGECLVLAGEPVFFTESGIEQCMDIMASLMDANESFATGTRAYWDKVHQLVSRKEALILQEDVGVRILERKDYIRGLDRLPGVKILALDSASGNEVWVFLDSTECR